MADSLVVRVNPTQIEVKPGEPSQVTITVRNRTDDVVSCRLAVDGPDPAWYGLDKDQIALFEQETGRAQLTLCPPPGVRPAIYELTVRAWNVEQETTENRATLQMQIPAPQIEDLPPGQETHEGPDQGMVAPDDRVAEERREIFAAAIEVLPVPVDDPTLPPPGRSWDLNVKNAGTGQDTVNFSVSPGLRPGWFSIEPIQLDLGPNEQKQARLKVFPPPDAPPRTYDFTVRTMSYADSNRFTDVSLRLQVRPGAAFDVVVSPRGQGAGDFRVALNSKGTSNSDLTIDLSASDEADACTYTFNPNPVFLPARQSATAALRVEPRQPPLPGETLSYPFTVVGVPHEPFAPQQTAPGRLTLSPPRLEMDVRPKVVSDYLTGNFALEVGNLSRAPVKIVLSCEDPESQCQFEIQPGRLEIQPRDRVKATVRVTAPGYLDGGEMPLRDYQVTITAKDEGETITLASKQVTLRQLRVPPAVLELVPRLKSSRGAVSYTVRARNPRAVPMDLLLDCGDDTGALEMRVKPNLIRLPPGGEREVKLRVRPKFPVPEDRKPTIVHNLHVTARSSADTGSAATVDGKYSQEYRTPGSRIFVLLLAWLIWLVKWAVFLFVVVLVVQFMLAGFEKVPGSPLVTDKRVINLAQNLNTFARGPARGVSRLFYDIPTYKVIADGVERIFSGDLFESRPSGG